MAAAQFALLVGQRALEMDHRREHLVDLQEPARRPALDRMGLHVAEREVVGLAVEALGQLGAQPGRAVAAGDELGPQRKLARLEAAEEVELVLAGHEERELQRQRYSSVSGSGALSVAASKSEATSCSVRSN